MTGLFDHNLSIATISNINQVQCMFLKLFSKTWIEKFDQRRCSKIDDGVRDI